MRADLVAPYAPVIIKLLQGVLSYDDATYWDMLLSHLSPVRDYFARIGLEVYLSESDGYAFVRQAALEDEAGQPIALPRLTRRDRLAYHVTLLCVLLRERLDQFDVSTSESDRLIMTLPDVRELLRPFVKERSDERVLLRKIDAAIERVVDLGFLRRLGGAEERFEVRRIIRARIDADTLPEIKARLERYGASDS
jgi:hypothetical protein